MKKALMVLSLLLLTCVQGSFFASSPTVKAVETVTVRVLSESVTVKLGQPFSVNITFENLPDGVTGFQFALSWNSSILRGLSMQEIAFHTATPQTDWWNIWAITLGYNNTAGFAAYAFTWQDSGRAISQGYAPLKGGNGSWASIALISGAPGETGLNLSRLVIGSSSLIEGIGVDGKVSVAKMLAGDINQDGNVNSADAGLLSAAFGSTPHDSNWNPNADTNNDGVVNILDAIILANNFGRTVS